MIALRIEEILRERGITKTQFAEMMGVAKQNVNLLLNTNNTQKIREDCRGAWDGVHRPLCVE